MPAFPSHMLWYHGPTGELIMDNVSIVAEGLFGFASWGVIALLMALTYKLRSSTVSGAGVGSSITSAPSMLARKNRRGLLESARPHQPSFQALSSSTSQVQSNDSLFE